MSKLRDKIAIAALQGMIQFLGWDPEAQLHGKQEKNKDVLTKSAYAYADAMLEERAKPLEIPNPHLKFLIRDLDLTARSINCLLSDGIVSIEDLVQRTNRDLRKVRLLGKHSLKEIKDMLTLRGLTLKGDE